MRAKAKYYVQDWLGGVDTCPSKTAAFSHAAYLRSLYPDARLGVLIRYRGRIIAKWLDGKRVK